MNWTPPFAVPFADGLGALLPGEGAGAGPFLLFAGAVALGAAHTLLPGHGKALLATHHILEDRPGRGRDRLAPLLSGLLLATSRMVAAIAVLALLTRFGTASGGGVNVTLIQLIGTATLMLLGLHLAFSDRPEWMVRGTGPGADHTGGSRLALPLVALALLPEPVAFSVLSMGVDRPDIVAPLILGLTLGSGLTLGLGAMLGSGARRGFEARFGTASLTASRRFVGAAMIAIATLGVSVILVAA